jgi:hypothetical protein
MSGHRLFRFPKPAWLNSPNTRTGGVYLAGALVTSLPPPLTFHPPVANHTFQFSLGFFFFIDAATFSHSNRNGSDIHIKFVDWIPGICSALGMLVINSIEKTRLSADSYSYSGTGVAWKARLVLFLGFALMAGGLAGSVVSDEVVNVRVGRVVRLMKCDLGCSGAEICGSGVPGSDAVFWDCECYCEWVDHAEVVFFSSEFLG